jgi:hypothetical protein
MSVIAFGRVDKDHFRMSYRARAKERERKSEELLHHHRIKLWTFNFPVHSPGHWSFYSGAKKLK